MMNKKSRYYKAFAAALGVHLIAAFALGAYTLLPPSKKDTIIEVTLAGAPKKKGAPKPAEAPPPPPPPPPQKDDIVDERLEEQPQRPPEQPRPPAPVTAPVTGTPAPAATEGAPDGADNGSPDGNGGNNGDEEVAVELPYITSKSDPSYPEECRRNRQEGTVLLRVLVGENGKPQDIEIAGSSGYDLLDEAAERAVYRWRFSPAKNKFGNAVKCYVTFPVVFRLR